MKNARRLIAASDNPDDGARNENKKQHQKKLRRIIGTHHKMGTALMRDVFNSISREFEYNFFNLTYYEEGFVNKTVSYLRYALGYTSNTSDAFPMFANER